MRKTDRGFTLVELLVVISIIGVLAMLLVPTIAGGQLIAAKARTTDTLNRLGMGLEAYKKDFGEYPPSNVESWTGSGPQRYRGAAKLVYYLGGPGGRGWGIDAAGHMPYENVPTMSGMASPTRSYGPYFKAAPDTVLYDTDPGTGQPYMCAFKDGFSPPGKILYFRYEPRPPVDSSGSPEANYQVSDNNCTNLGKDVGDQDSQSPARKNYYKQLYFLQAVGVPLTAGTSATPGGSTTTIAGYRFLRTDYVLISPGQDGIYGYVDTSNKPVDRTTKVAMKCDDITNLP